MMKSFTPTQKQLLNLLSNGACFSGQYLGDKLGVSRAAIWKHIEKLEQLGLTIERLPKQGYRVKHPFVPLSETRIQQALEAEFKEPIDCHAFASIDSTNRFLRTIPAKPQMTCCIAEAQTKGRGRFGRHWHSPFGENIYCSLSMHIEGDPSHLSGLSLVVSLAMHSVLQAYTDKSIAIKWPNDLLWEHQKLAGTLIEMTAEGNSGTDIIIGMGLNINSISASQTSIDRPWCSLRDITQQSFDRNQLIIELIKTLKIELQVFLQAGFQGFQARWNALDYLKNQEITVSKPTEKITGVGCGVSKAGYLLLKDKKGAMHTFSSGDTTLAQEKT